MMQLLLLGSTLVLGAVDPFEAAKGKATEVPSLQKLLEAYAGKCKATDPVEEKECADRAKTAQAGFKGKVLYANLGSGFEGLMESADAPAGRATVLLTPVIDAGAEVALTFAKPQKLDAQGTIIVPRYPVEGPLLDDGMMANDVKRLIKTGGIAVEIVFTIKGPWQLKKKDGEVVKGLEVAVSSVRLSNRRTGKPIISQGR